MMKIENEKDFVHVIINEISAISKCHMSRVESPIVSPGIPDINYCIDGVEGNIEAKYGNENHCPIIRSSQRVWFRERLKAEGKPVVIFIDDRVEKLPVYGIVPGCNVLKIKPHHASWRIWYNHAIKIWRPNINWIELIRMLKNT